MNEETKSIVASNLTLAWVITQSNSPISPGADSDFDAKKITGAGRLKAITESAAQGQEQEPGLEDEIFQAYRNFLQKLE